MYTSEQVTIFSQTNEKCCLVIVDFFKCPYYKYCVNLQLQKYHYILWYLICPVIMSNKYRISLDIALGIALAR